MPIIQSSQEIVTFADCVMHVCDAFALDRTGLNERHARSAVRRAYRDFPSRHQWNYYYRQRLLQTVEDYATGTVEFDYTGGAYERVLTLTTGTWPSWAAYGRVIIDDVHYEVEDRKSNSEITLSETSNPGQDIAAGETYQLYRNSYPLPVNFGTMVSLWSVSEQLEICFEDQRTHHDALQHYYDTPDSPRHATIRATGKYLSGQEIVFGPPPGSAMTYDMLYLAHPRPLSIDEHSSGTVAINASSATVTGTSSAFPTNCVGSIIRFASGAVKPSSLVGSIDGTDNPFVHQGVIKSRASATSLTLEEVMPAAVGNLSGVGYTISDPIDIDVNRMLTAFHLACEAEYSRLARRDDLKTTEQFARTAFLRAMEADELVVNNRRRIVRNSIDTATVSDSE